MLLNIYITIAAILILPAIMEAQVKEHIVFGGNQHDFGNTIALLPNANYLIGGSTKSEGAGSNDIALYTVDSSGCIISKAITGFAHHDVAKHIEKTKDGGFAIAGWAWDNGPARFNATLEKYDANQNREWIKYYGGSHRDLGFAVKEFDNGDFGVIGHTRSLKDDGDIYFVRTQADGTRKFHKSYGGSTKDHGFDLLPQPDNSALLLGTLGGFFGPTSVDFHATDADIVLLMIDENGTELWQKQYGDSAHDFGKKIIPSEDGGYFIVGSTQSYGAGNFDVLLLKLNSSYIKEWHKTFGGPEFDYGESIVTTTDNSLIITGTTASASSNGKPDIFIIKTDRFGNELWSLNIGGAESDYGSQAIATPDNGVAVIGSTKSHGNGSYDALMFRLTQNGLINSFSGFSRTPLETQVYPNPIANEGTLTVFHSEHFDYRIFSIDGKIVYSGYNENSNLKLNAMDFSPGIYLYEVISCNGTSANGKLVIR